MIPAMKWDKLENWIVDNAIGAYKVMTPLSLYTSWRIGGPARMMVWPEDEEKIAALWRHCNREGYPVRILGAGTNLLVADEGVEALVINTRGLDHMEWNEGSAGADAAAVFAGAGLPLSRLAGEAARRGLRGLEFAAGIPGSFGGALVMNAGAFEGQISDLVEYVRCMDGDGRIHVLDSQEAVFGYRVSGLKTAGMLIVGGGLRLVHGNEEKIQLLMKEYLTLRQEKQPLDLPSGGSVFRNPTGDGAGRYIDRAGLKGLREGDAQISPLHANFIVNLGGAKASDVRTLMDAAKDEVLARFGVRLESEIVYWG